MGDHRDYPYVCEEVSVENGKIFEIWTNAPGLTNGQVCEVWDEYQAKRIVTAINAHDDLVKMLTTTRGLVEMFCNNIMLDRVDAALAKAKGVS